MTVRSMLQKVTTEAPPCSACENVERLISERRNCFDPDAIAPVIAAYHAVLMELRLSHREDAGTLMVAKRVIEIAARGERNPQRLAEATLDALCQ